MISVVVFMEDFGLSGLVSPLAPLDLQMQLDQIHNGETNIDLGADLSNQDDKQLIPPGIHPAGYDDGGAYHWILKKPDAATGKWEGHFKTPDQYLTNIINTVNSHGDLYQKEYLPGSVNPGIDKTSPKIIRFDDGTDYEYDIQNKDLIKKMYHPANTTPDWDPTDSLAIGGGAASKVFPKLNILRPFGNLYDQKLASLAAHTLKNSGSKFAATLTSSSVRAGQIPMDTYNKRYHPFSVTLNANQAKSAENAQDVMDDYDAFD